MKIQSLISEAKFAAPEYAYHATNADNLKSILKNGLVPNFKDDGYGSNETSAFGYTLTPLKGIYFTRVAKDAVYIAKSLAGENIILVCKIQSKQAELDEDRLSTAILDEKAFLAMLRTSYREEFNFDVDAFVQSGVVDNIVSEHTKLILSKLNIDQRAKSNAKVYIEKHLNALADFYIDADSGGGNWNETGVKDSQDELTKALRQLAHGDKETHHTFKINTTVGFSGANKIVGIYHIDTRLGWGDLGELHNYAYHIVKRPSQIAAK